MAVTLANIRRFISGGRVYWDATPALNWGRPNILNGIPQGLTLPALDVGATRQGSEFMYHAHMQAGKIEQTSGPVVPVVTEETIGAMLRYGEGDFNRMRDAFLQSVPLVAAGGGVNANVLHLGNRVDVTGRVLTVVAPQIGLPGKFYGFQIYNAYPVNEVKIPVKRGDTERFIEVTYAGTADVTRQDGDQLGLWFEDV